MEPAPADRAQDDRPPPHVITPAEAPSRARMRERSAPLPASPVLLGTLVAILDAVAIGGAGLAADALAASEGARHAAVTALIVALTVAFSVKAGAYDHAVLFRGVRQMRQALGAAAAALATTVAAASALGATERVGTAWLAFAIPLIALSVAGARAAVGGLLRQEAHALGARRAVILGAGPQADRFVATLREQGPGSIRVLGLVDERGPRTVAPPEQVTDLGGLATLGSMIRRNEVDVVIVAVPWSAEARLADLLQRLAPYPVEIRLAPDLLSQELADGPGEPVILRRRPISGWCAVAKRVQDVVLAISALAVAAFPMLLIALAIRLDTPGPVLFRQRRTGFNDKPFDVLKFRTMYDEAADHDVVLQVQAGDPRVTRVGAILRRTSLDELPQLINVLRGEMSFVGPRPHAPGTRAGTRRFDEVVANYAARHRVKPGLTGLAQVRGFRGPTPNEDQVVRRVESDLEYIENWSLRLDAVIILRTLLEVARMRNAC